MNLVVAKGVPALADLDIDYYVQLADQWAGEIERSIPACDANFRRNPECWENDLELSRLSIVWWYLEEVLQVAYREDQKDTFVAEHNLPLELRQGILYTDPTDLFLNGVMDTRRGTCGTMALLYVALCWRLGWPVSLACVGSHFVARYDDGQKAFNIEASQLGDGRGLSCPTDRWYMDEYSIPQRALDCGSDLRAVNPREMLGLFLGLRARHLENVHHRAEAEPDYLLARYLFPANRYLYISQNQVSVQCSMRLFEPHEKGHPIELSHWLQDVVRIAPWRQKPSGEPTTSPRTFQEKGNDRCVDIVLQQMVGGKGFM